MSIHDHVCSTINAGDSSAKFLLNVVFKEVSDDGPTYFVAECLEMPGCVSQGDTQEEAHRNIEDAIHSCLSVVFEDCMKQIVDRNINKDLRGISSQGRLKIDPTPRLQYEYA